MRELTEWEQRILEQLRDKYRGQDMTALARHLDMPYDNLYRVLGMGGGIGPQLLERLRHAVPLIVGSAFIPEGFVLAPSDRTIVVDDQPSNGQEAEPCAP